nr:hypothetical protein [Tanacetum cinerariifolium]
MRRVGKGFSGVETPLFEGMLVGVIGEEGDAEEQVQDVADVTAAQGADTAVIGDERMIDALDSDAGVALMDDKEVEKKTEEAKVAGHDQVKGRQAEIYQIDMDHASKVLKVVTAASESVTAASTTIAAAEPQVPTATITVVPAADFPMSLFQEALDACVALTRRVEHLEYDKVAQALEITKLKRRVKKLEKANKV